MQRMVLSTEHLVVADEQTGGRGRRGRAWESQKGVSIYMSLVLKPEIEPNHASMLTLIAAMAVAGGIEKTTGLECKIKWPNDIVVHGKKVCGILTEMSTQMDYINYIVIGIGINVQNEAFPGGNRRGCNLTSDREREEAEPGSYYRGSLGGI